MTSDDNAKKTLRQWYLASLRKSAYDQLAGQHATPAALISLDRQIIQKLIADKGSSSSEDDDHASVFNREDKMLAKYSVWIILFSLALHLAISLFVKTMS